jgi:uncharacterized protein YqfA (UPF0365 family)
VVTVVTVLVVTVVTVVTEVIVVAVVTVTNWISELHRKIFQRRFGRVFLQCLKGFSE